MLGLCDWGLNVISNLKRKRTFTFKITLYILLIHSVVFDSIFKKWENKSLHTK